MRGILVGALIALVVLWTGGLGILVAERPPQNDAVMTGFLLLWGLPCIVALLLAIVLSVIQLQPRSGT